MSKKELIIVLSRCLQRFLDLKEDGVDIGSIDLYLKQLINKNLKPQKTIKGIKKWVKTHQTVTPTTLT